MVCRALKQPEISILREPFCVAQADFRLGNAPYEVTMTSIMTNFFLLQVTQEQFQALNQRRFLQANLLTRACLAGLALIIIVHRNCFGRLMTNL